VTIATAVRPPAAAGADDGVQGAGGRRFFDAVNGVWMVKVFPGEYYVTSQADEVLVTILGSCVSACIRDPRTGIGGMNHFMLAHGQSQSWGGDPESTRYGNFAMEKLINEMLKLGCSRQSLEIKVFGGGNVTDTRNLIGTQNCEFVVRYLDSEGLSIAAQDLGGQYPRRIHYYPTSGRVVRRLLAGSETTAVAREESEYAGRLKSRKVGGEIELFS
jgi:chemotaxis protein CheD